MAGHSSTRRTVLIAGAANLFVGVIKLVAGILVGSSGMLAEAAHSAADTLDQAFLLTSLLAAADPVARNAALTDALAEAAFAAAGWVGCRGGQLRSRRRKVTSCISSRSAAATGIATSAPTMPSSAPPMRTAMTDRTAGTLTVLPMILGTSR